MIKIIKEGTRKKCTCDECGCYFSYEKEDVKIEKINGGFGGEKLIIDCPQCNIEILLDNIYNK